MPPDGYGAKDDPGLAALAALDEALRQRPHTEGAAWTKATQCVVAFRDRLLTEPPGPERRRKLEHVGAVLSMVLAGHHPLGLTPWHEIEAARGWLADLVAEEGKAA